VEECGPCPVFASFTLAFALQPRKKHGKTSVRVKKNLSHVKKNLSHSTVYILRKTPTHYKTLTNTHITKPTCTHTRAHTHTHTLQNNIKPPQYKLKQNANRKSNRMGRKNIPEDLMIIFFSFVL
jgi:hypothetical protein